MHKTIIFDMGKVLIPFDFQLGYRALEGMCPYTASEIPRRIGTTDLVHRFEKGLIEPRDFVSQLSALLELRAGYDFFCEAWSCIFGGPQIPEDMLESLASRYRLLLLSNTNSLHFQMIRENYPFIRHFHDLVLSFEVHALKPEAGIYEAAIERAGCRPEECFFTDDIVEYVDAARRHGMDAVQFQSTDQLQREMRARGIEW